MFLRISTNYIDVFKTACNIINCMEDNTSKMKIVEIPDMVIENDTATIPFYMTGVYI